MCPLFLVYKRNRSNMLWKMTTSHSSHWSFSPQRISVSAHPVRRPSYPSLSMGQESEQHIIAKVTQSNRYACEVRLATA